MAEIDRKAVGEKLRLLRGDKPQKVVADAIGVTTMAISSYERGERMPSDNKKVELANYFNRRVEDIFFAN